MIIAFTGCKSEETKQKEREEVYFLNEDFTIIEKSENIETNDSRAFIVRQWKIQREARDVPDSIWVGVILSDPRVDNCNCGESDFQITDELWFNKNVGDKVHFDYIRKDRFFKVHVNNIKNLEKPIQPKPEPEPIAPITTDTSDMTKIQIEMKILELEREIMYLKSKL